MNPAKASGSPAVPGPGAYDSVADLGELYDHVAPYASRADAAFYVEAARGVPGDVLELGCGTGRILLPIARGGARIVGIDRSEQMLARCRQKIDAEPVDVQERIELCPADMRRFSLEREFGAVIIPFRGLQHQVAVEDQMAVLERAHRHLAPGGLLVFDVFHPNLGRLAMPSVEETEDTPETVLPGGRIFRRTSRVTAVHQLAQTSDVELTYYVRHSDGREDRRVQAFPMRWFLWYELEHLLARCGFAVRDAYGDFDRSPLAEGSPEFVVVATKT